MNPQEWVNATTQQLSAAFSRMEWAEDEIENATGRHPSSCMLLFHGSALLNVRDIGRAMDTEFVYRSHAAELLERVVAGTDTRAPTAAELCAILAQVSLRVPLHDAAAGLYHRLWLQAFPANPSSSDQAAQQAHYEHLHATHMDELEQWLRRSAADPQRQLADIHCTGLHHGAVVACPYAGAATPPAGDTPSPPKPSQRKRSHGSRRRSAPNGRTR